MRGLGNVGSAGGGGFEVREEEFCFFLGLYIALVSMNPNNHSRVSERSFFAAGISHEKALLDLQGYLPRLSTRAESRLALSPATDFLGRWMCTSWTRGVP